MKIQINQTLSKNICMFFKETGIIEETRSIASSYFNSSLEYLKNLDGINTNELTQLVELIEKGLIDVPKN